MEESSEKPSFDENAAKSRACSSMAIAGWSASDENVEMIPDGMLAREKPDPRGMRIQDFIVMTVLWCTRSGATSV